jgi:2-keto-3-deoxy-L-rhamnonate aldolase RhmA
MEKCRDLGFTFMALGSDGGAVNSGLRQNLAALRAAGK